MNTERSGEEINDPVEPKESDDWRAEDSDDSTQEYVEDARSN